MDKDFNLTIKEAKSLMSNSKNIHTFYNPGFGLIGGDHSRKSILKDIENAERLNLAGEQAQNMGHALAILKKGVKVQSDILFVETIKEKVDKLLDDANVVKPVVEERK